MRSIYDELISYSQSSAYPFHMPGHKRNLSGDILNEISKIDLTEIDGFDNLHDAEGILLNAQNRAAQLYGATESFFLVNGSTCGILSAISACVPKGGWLMMGRNSHKSVYHAAYLLGLHTTYLYPKQVEGFSFCSGVTLEDVKSAYQAFIKNHPKEKISAVLITSPTYEGVVSEVKEISEYLHEKNIILIVDGAHGAHFGMVPELPEHSNQSGADIVINSTHKTLPAMTQTAILHLNGKFVDSGRLKRYLRIYQSSSPSYILMASIDRAVQWMQNNKEELFGNFLIKRRELNQHLKECERLKIFSDTQSDPCKLVISTRETCWTGKELYDRLRLNYGLQMEMMEEDYVVAILTIMDTEEGLKRLPKAVLEIDYEIDSEMVQGKKKIKSGVQWQNLHAKAYCTIEEAMLGNQEEISLIEANNRICAEYIYIYPPGIPILAPGEIIEETHIEVFKKMEENKLTIKGIYKNKLKVLCQQNGK